MLTYFQATGEIWSEGSLLGRGFSGSAAMRNRPDCQHVRLEGPIPCGKYTVSKAVRHCNSLLFRLRPLTVNVRNQRYFIQSSGISRGCIDVPNETLAIVASAVRGGERFLEVV